MATLDPMVELKDAYRRGFAELLKLGVTRRKIAAVAEVSPSQPAKWISGTTLPNAANRQLLADKWPAFFAHERLAPSWIADLYPDVLAGRPTEVLGLSSGSADVYADATKAVLMDPVDQADREILHIGMHVDVPGGDAASSDEYFDGEDQEGNLRFRDALVRRTVEDRWHYKGIIATNDTDRLDNLLIPMVNALGGPSAEVRAYRMDPPQLLNALIIARRDASLAYDNVRNGKPRTAVWFQDTTVVDWLARYFDDLWDAAPFRVRERKGPNDPEIARLRAEIERR